VEKAKKKLRTHKFQILIPKRTSHTNTDSEVLFRKFHHFIGQEKDCVVKISKFRIRRVFPYKNPDGLRQKFYLFSRKIQIFLKKMSSILKTMNIFHFICGTF
jgi:hypothetical protein